MKLGKIILLGALAAGAAWFYKKYQDGKSASDAAPDGKDFPEPDFVYLACKRFYFPEEGFG